MQKIYSLAQIIKIFLGILESTIESLRQKQQERMGKEQLTKDSRYAARQRLIQYC